MPARAVPKNYRNVTGQVYNSRTRSSSAFDSTLERDCLLLDFDLAVDFYKEQPVTIEYCDSRDSLRRYTPDVLVRYRSAVNAISVPLSVLCEVKYRDDLCRPTMEEIGYRTPISSRLTAYPAASGSTFTGCFRPALRGRSNRTP
jgi:hypothetical protein